MSFPATSRQDVSPSLRAEVYLQLSLLRQPQILPAGVYCTPDEVDLLTWHGVIFVRTGPYVGGIFRFDIRFPPAFLLGTAVPDVVFPPTLLHPLVDPTTFRLSLSPAFPNVSRGPSGSSSRSSNGSSANEAWNPAKHNIKHLLDYVHDCFTSKLLSSISERQAANKEVYSMYRDNQPLFLKLASQSKHLSTSKNALFDPSSGSGLPASSSSSSSASSSGEARTAASEDAGGADGQAMGSQDRRRAIRFREMEEAEVESVKKRIQERYVGGGEGMVVDAA